MRFLPCVKVRQPQNNYMVIVLTVYDAGLMILTGFLAKLVKILLGLFKKYFA